MPSNIEELIHKIMSDGILCTPSVIAAFRAVDRGHFVSEEYRDEAYEDYPLSIGYGQTISQPSTVAFMLELLQAKRGDKILDIGSGSGWTTALLAHIVGQEGRVWGIEIIPELVEFGRKNLAKYTFSNAKIIKGGKTVGLSEEAPFDKILVSAAAEKLPQKLMSQLKAPIQKGNGQGGTLVIPIGSSVFKIFKTSPTQTKQKEYPGFVFVPYK